MPYASLACVSPVRRPVVDHNERRAVMASRSTAVQVAKEPAPLSVFERADALFDAVSKRAYEIFQGGGGVFGRELDDWFKAERELLHPLHISMNESGDALAVRAEVPGFSEKELEINVEPRRLVIRGKRETKKEEKKGKTIYSETCADQIMRVVDLPADVETDKVRPS